MTQAIDIVYSDAFERYDFGPTHPMRPTRLKLTFELMKAVNLLSSPNVKVSEPRPATREDLQLFHKDEYLDLVKRLSNLGEGYLDMGDTPAFKGCYEASALGAGASLEAVDSVMSGRAAHAMNIAGGLHHAHRERASGFCIFNDPAIAIAYLKKRHGVKRLLYLDVDAHHGDGVMYGFYSDPDVLDIDFHEDGRHLFPGTGFTNEIGEGKGSGVKINVPLPPFVDDQTYLKLFRAVVPAAVRKFRPEVILLQCGADSHANDLLAHLQITSIAYCEIAQTMHELAHEVSQGRYIVLGGGGYNISNVARIWTLVASVVAEYDCPDNVPVNWKKLFEALIGESAPDNMKTGNEATVRFGQEKMLQQADGIIEDLRARIPLLS